MLWATRTHPRPRCQEDNRVKIVRWNHLKWNTPHGSTAGEESSQSVLPRCLTSQSELIICLLADVFGISLCPEWVIDSFLVLCVSQSFVILFKESKAWGVLLCLLVIVCFPFWTTRAAFSVSQFKNSPWVHSLSETSCFSTPSLLSQLLCDQHKT